MESSQTDNQEIYQLIAEYSRDLISVHTPDGTFQYLTPSVKDLLGFEPDELIGVNPYEELFHSEDVERIQKESHEKATQGIYKNRIEYRILHKDGHYIWFESYTNSVFGEDGTIEKLLVSSRDITRKKELEMFLDETGQLASVGGWQYSPFTNELEWTRETYRIHEVPIGENVNIEKGIGFYHTDYQAEIREHLNALLNRGIPYDMEGKIITRTGQEKWVRTKGFPEFANGNLVKIHGTFQDVTDRKLMEEQLKANEAKNRQHIENAQDLIFWLDRQGHFTYLNPMAFSITGYDESELVNQHFEVLLESPEFEKANAWFYNLINKNTDKFYDEIQIVTKNGEQKWLGIQAQKIEANDELREISAVARDITERVSAEEALKATSSRLNSLIENLHSGIIMENENREVVIVNQSFCDLFSLPYQCNDLIGKDCHTLMEEGKHQFKDSETFGQSVTELTHNRQLKLGEEWQLSNGKTIELDYIPIFQDNHYLGHLWQYQDVSKRKTEEEKLIEAKEKAEEASKAKADFLSTMSHEIRTPLNSVIGISHLLLKNDPRPDQKENLKALRFSGENLLNLINDILDFNKIEANKIDLENETFNLKEVINGIQKTHSLKAEDKGLTLAASFDPELPEHVKGDQTRIAQILSNLVGNAVKFTQTGNITIEAKSVKTDQNTITVYMAVVDTGNGIPENKLDTIFQSFTQSSKSTNRQFGGTGLGLAISKRLLELQNSHLAVKSEVGKGTRFEFTLDFEKEQNQTLQSEDQKKQAEEWGIELKGFKVLLVEDNQMNIFMAKQFLDGWGIKVDVAKNGNEALQATFAHQFDLILMDLQMPEMDGYEATKKIRELKGYRDIPIIALTASALIQVQDQVYNAGMNDYVTKPFEPANLYQKFVKNLREAGMLKDE